MEDNRDKKYLRGGTTRVSTVPLTTSLESGLIGTYCTVVCQKQFGMVNSNFTPRARLYCSLRVLTTVRSKSMFSSGTKRHSPSNSASANRLASQSQASQQPQFPTKSQSQSRSAQQTQQLQPISPWSAHAPPSGQSLSPFFREAHSLSTSATATGELFLFGGYIHSSNSLSNDIFVISTRNFSTTPLQTSGDIPSPRYGHRAVFTKTVLLIWGGTTGFSYQNAQHQSDDDSFYLLNLGKLDLFMSRPLQPPADPNFFHPSIARVDPHHGPWSRAWRSLPPYHDVSWFQALCLRWPDRQRALK